MSTFEQAPELKNKIKISWTLLLGIITFAILGTYFVTDFYLTTSTIESRMDKRYERHEEKFKELEKEIDKLKEYHNTKKDH